MSDEPREPATSEQSTGPGAEDQPTREGPALDFFPPAGEPSEPPSGPVGPPATPPELWSSPAGERDKAPRVETVDEPAGSPAGGGLDAAKVVSVARSLSGKPEVLLGAAFGGGILLAIIIRRLGS